MAAFPEQAADGVSYNLTSPGPLSLHGKGPVSRNIVRDKWLSGSFADTFENNKHQTAICCQGTLGRTDCKLRYDYVAKPMHGEWLEGLLHVRGAEKYFQKVVLYFLSFNHAARPIN